MASTWGNSSGHCSTVPWTRSVPAWLQYVLVHSCFSNPGKGHDWLVNWSLRKKCGEDGVRVSEITVLLTSLNLAQCSDAAQEWMHEHEIVCQDLASDPALL